MKIHAVGSLLATVLTLVFTPLASGQRTPFTYDEVIGLIINLRAQTVVSNSTVGPTISSIVQGFIDQHWYGGIIKRNLFTKVRAKRLTKEFKAADIEDSDLLRLFYTSRQGVPFFITDRNLKSRVPKHGAHLKKRIARSIARKSISSKLIILDRYSPSDAAALVNAMAQPWYTYPKSWDFEPTPSWASESLWDIYYWTRVSEITKRSVVVKLLVEEGLLEVRDSVSAYFTWSGIPDISINLSFTRWTDDDKDDLNRLLTNSYYSAMAQRQLDRMNNPQPL